MGSAWSIIIIIIIRLVLVTEEGEKNLRGSKHNRSFCAAKLSENYVLLHSDETTSFQSKRCWCQTRKNIHTAEFKLNDKNIGVLLLVLL